VATRGAAALARRRDENRKTALSTLHARLSENMFNGEGVADFDIRLPFDLVKR
jgi:hypothetical protein